MLKLSDRADSCQKTFDLEISCSGVSVFHVAEGLGLVGYNKNSSVT